MDETIAPFTDAFNLDHFTTRSCPSQENTSSQQKERLHHDEHRKTLFGYTQQQHWLQFNVGKKVLPYDRHMTRPSKSCRSSCRFFYVNTWYCLDNDAGHPWRFFCDTWHCLDSDIGPLCRFFYATDGRLGLHGTMMAAFHVDPRMWLTTACISATGLGWRALCRCEKTVMLDILQILRQEIV